MQDAVKKLVMMGQMPSENENTTDERIGEYQEWLDAIITPIGLDDAYSLTLLFPESSLFGLEWSLLHIFETVETDDVTYRKIIEQCPSQEWRGILLKRFENYLDRQR